MLGAGTRMASGITRHPAVRGTFTPVDDEILRALGKRQVER